MTPVGQPYGKNVVVDQRTQRYQAAWDLSTGMMGSWGNIGAVIIVASLPELGADDANKAGGPDKPISPWGDIYRMMKMLLDAKDQFTEALSVTNPSTQSTEEFKELIDWKRTYSVGDDTWHNEESKFWIRGSATLTSFISENRLHI